MKMKFLACCVLFGLTACGEKPQEQSQMPTQTEVKQEQVQSQAIESKPVEVPKINIMTYEIDPTETKQLDEDYFLAYDITQFLPHSAYNQTELFHEIVTWSNYLDLPVLQECLSHNSFAQTANGIRFQAQRNYLEAKKYYEMASEKGNAFAQNRLGEMYLLGLGVNKDVEKAKYWFEQSAQKGYFFAESALGAIYLDFPLNENNVTVSEFGGLWFPKDKITNARIGQNANIPQATYWLTRASRQNDENSINMMEHFNLSIDETKINERLEDVIIENPTCVVPSGKNNVGQYSGKLIILGKNRDYNYNTPLYKRFGHIEIGYLYLNNEGRINSISSSKWGDGFIYIGSKIVTKENQDLKSEIQGKILPPNAGEQ